MVSNDRANTSPRWERPVAIALLLLGTALRLRQYFAARPLWLDEASLALNIAPKSFAALARPLDFEQVVPIPFLWGVKLSTVILGNTEPGLRLVPLLAGIVTPLLIWRAARHFTDPLFGLASLALAAVSPALVYYSNELKPYATDAFFTALVVWLTLCLLSNPDSRARWIAWLLAGIAAALSSLPVVFALGASAVALLSARSIHRAPHQLRRLGASLSLWAVAFGAAYAHSLQKAPGAPLKNFWGGWAGAFLSPGKVGHDWKLIADVLQQDLIGDATWPHRAAQATVIFVILAAGFARLARRLTGPEFLLIVLPVLGAATVSLAGRYPFSPRTLIFALPVLFILLPGVLFQRGASVAVLGTLVLCLPSLAVSIPRAVAPHRREDVARVLEEVRSRRTAGEPLYVYARSIPPFVWYSTDWNQPAEPLLALLRRAFSADGPSFENSPSRGRPVGREGDDLVWRSPQGPDLFGIYPGAQSTFEEGRHLSPDPGWAANEARRIADVRSPTAWLLFSHIVDGGDVALDGALRLNGATIIDRIHEEGAAAYRVRLR